jgi:Heterokaryon incompatibility protein (HET)
MLWSSISPTRKLWKHARPELKGQSYYQPLRAKNREIRVLDILPASNTESDIHVSLRTASLEKPSRFQALSYCWGTADTTKSIFVDKNEVQVAVNLEDALRHIRKTDEEVCLWIDALCISQSDVWERNQQVQIMGEIYKSAECVLVWLGEESDDSDHALDTCQLWGSHHQTDSRYLVDKIREDGTEAFDERSWKAVRKLINRP